MSSGEATGGEAGRVTGWSGRLGQAVSAFALAAPGPLGRYLVPGSEPDVGRPLTAMARAHDHRMLRLRWRDISYSTDVAPEEVLRSMGARSGRPKAKGVSGGATHGASFVVTTGLTMPAWHCLGRVEPQGSGSLIRAQAGEASPVLVRLLGLVALLPLAALALITSPVPVLFFTIVMQVSILFATRGKGGGADHLPMLWDALPPRSSGPSRTPPPYEPVEMWSLGTRLRAGLAGDRHVRVLSPLAPAAVADRLQAVVDATTEATVAPPWLPAPLLGSVSSTRLALALPQSGRRRTSEQPAVRGRITGNGSGAELRLSVGATRRTLLTPVSGVPLLAAYLWFFAMPGSSTAARVVVTLVAVGALVTAICSHLGTIRLRAEVEPRVLDRIVHEVRGTIDPMHSDPTRVITSALGAPVPELIEVEVYRRLTDRVVGRTVSHVEAPDDWFVKGTTAGHVRDAVTGATIEATGRRGKLLTVDLGPDRPVLGLRFGMTGRLVLDGEVAPIEKLEYASGRDDPRWDRFAVRFTDGGRLRISDPRRLGGVELDPDLDRLGPDAWTVTSPQLGRALAGSTTALKARLLDQSRLAGLGNLLTDETLWRVGLRPDRPAGALDPDDVKRLAGSVRRTVRLLDRRGGSHRGDLQEQRTRHGRCPRDGTELRREAIGGRTTYWCPAHQH